MLRYIRMYIAPGASKGTPGDAKFVTEIIGEQKRKLKENKICLFVSRGMSALNRLNSQINVLMFMPKML